MKITGCLCTFDDHEYLDVAITSFKDAVDKLYLIEGSWKSSQGYMQTEQRSGSETYNILEKHIDNKKVFLVRANESSEKSQRQIGLELAKNDGSDWHWFLDSDEVYTPSLIFIIKATLNKFPANVCGLRLRSFNFINSFNTWYDGNYARIARVTPQANFVVSNDVAWPDVSNPQILTFSPQARFYHYCYVKKDPAQFWRKMHYHETENPSFKHQVAPQYDLRGFMYTIPSDIPRWKFSGAHPKVMQNHQNIKDNIYNDTDIKFQTR